MGDLGKARRALSAALNPKSAPITRLPGRAALARRWPSLRVNRMNWRWCDDVTGARGSSSASLLEYLNKSTTD